MPSLTKVTPSMFSEVYEAVLRDWAPALGEAVWRRAFAADVAGPEGQCGYALTDGGRIVGVLGTIFSERRIGDRTARLCNLHSWRVKPEYRASSLLLLRPALALRDHTLTDLTPTDGVIAIERRLGFRALDRLATVLLPLPGTGPARAVVEELSGPAEQHRARLAPADLRIYRDHQGVACAHTLVRVGDRYCYVVHSRIEGHWLPHCAVHYVSDARLFAEAHAAIRRHLARRSGRPLVVVDARLLGDLRLPCTVRVRATEKLYRSRDLAPHQVDSLYSELAFYKHPILPRLRARLGMAARACAPRFLGRALAARLPRPARRPASPGPPRPAAEARRRWP
jgi:hypothetical protein